MKKILFVFAIALLGAVSVNAQSAQTRKGTIKRGERAAKTGTVAEPAGSTNFSKALEKKAQSARAEAERKNMEKKMSGKKATDKKEQQAKPKNNSATKKNDGDK